MLLLPLTSYAELENEAGKTVEGWSKTRDVKDNGTVSIPAMDIPWSSALSEQTRHRLERQGSGLLLFKVI